MMYDSSACMLKMMTAGGRSSFCARVATSMPLSLGMPMSTMSRSGRCSSQSRTASSPSAASATTEWPVSSSRLRSPRRTMPWSSASSTRKPHLRHRRRQRQVQRDRRALADGTRDGHVAVKFLDALFKSTETETITAPCGIESDPIVDHRDAQSIVMARDLYLDGVRLGVTEAIGQRFLHSSIYARLMPIRPRVELSVHVQLDVHSVSAGDVAHVPFQRGSQTEVIEHAGAQPEREISNSAEHLVDQQFALGHGGAEPCVRRRPASLDSAQLHSQGREHLRDVVVKLT